MKAIIGETQVRVHEYKGKEVGDYCNAEGYWIDPAGGIHSPNEEDPAKMYE